MNRQTWDQYRAATGAERKRLLDDLVASQEPLAQDLMAKFVAGTRYYIEEMREDLIQAARIGIIRAIEKWDPERGAFSTVAGFWCRHEMQQVTRDATPISLPHRAHLPKKKQDALAAFTAQKGRAPTAEERQELGIADSDLARAQKAAVTFASVDALEQEPAVGGDEEPIEDTIDRQRDMRALAAFMSRLTPAEKRAFWAGDRPDLAKKAKEYVAARRAVKGEK